MNEIGCEKRETVKDIILQTNCCLLESNAVLNMICDALFGAKVQEHMDQSPAKQQEPPLIDMLRVQREIASNILLSVKTIQKGLW